MADVYYERLSQSDNSFLIFESAQAAMHVASTQLHPAQPLRGENGTIDIQQLQESSSSSQDERRTAPEEGSDRRVVGRRRASCDLVTGLIEVRQAICDHKYFSGIRTQRQAFRAN